MCGGLENRYGIRFSLDFMDTDRSEQDMDISNAGYSTRIQDKTKQAPVPRRCEYTWRSKMYRRWSCVPIGGQ